MGFVSIFIQSMCILYPIGSMYGVYIYICQHLGILMVNVIPYMAYMDPMGVYIYMYIYIYEYIQTCGKPREDAKITYHSWSRICLLFGGRCIVSMYIYIAPQLSIISYHRYLCTGWYPSSYKLVY